MQYAWAKIKIIIPTRIHGMIWLVTTRTSILITILIRSSSKSPDVFPWIASMRQANSINIVIADIPGVWTHWVEGIGSVYLIANNPTTDSTIHKVFSFDKCRVTTTAWIFRSSTRPHRHWSIVGVLPPTGRTLLKEIGHVQIGNHLPKSTSTGMAWVKKHCSWNNVLYAGLTHPWIHWTFIQHSLGHGQVEKKRKHQL